MKKKLQQCPIEIKCKKFHGKLSEIIWTFLNKYWPDKWEELKDNFNKLDKDMKMIVIQSPKFQATSLKIFLKKVKVMKLSVKLKIMNSKYKYKLILKKLINLFWMKNKKNWRKIFGCSITLLGLRRKKQEPTMVKRYKRRETKESIAINQE